MENFAVRLLLDSFFFFFLYRHIKLYGWFGKNADMSDICVSVLYRYMMVLPKTMMRFLLVVVVGRGLRWLQLIFSQRPWNAILIFIDILLLV